MRPGRLIGSGVAGVWLAGCLRAAAPVADVPDAPPPAPVSERWVDAHRNSPEGDGSRERPLRTLGEALAAVAPGQPALIHLRAGLYQGPFTVPPAVTLRGHGAVVLHADAEAEAAVTVERDAELSGLMVQGGQVGIRVPGSARLDQVKLSGQRRDGVEVKGALRALGLEVEGTITGTVGVRVTAGARADLEDATFRGGLGEGLRVEEGGFARLHRSRSEGAAQAVRCIGGEVEVDGLAAHGGRMAAVGVGRCRLRVRDLTVLGHEYALLAGGESDVRARGITSLRPERAGVGLGASGADLEDVVVVGAGSHGALTAVGSRVRLRRFLFSSSVSYGLNLHGGDADVSHGAILRVRDDGGGAGDGVHVRIGTARLSHLTLSRLDGAGVLAAQGAKVTLRDVEVDAAAWAGVLAETGATIDAVSLGVRRSKGVAVAVPGEAAVSVDALAAEDNAQGTIWVECTQGAELSLGRVRAPDLAELRSPCVGRLGGR